MSPTRRDAFTLIEILISIMIFSVVSTAVVGILFAATNIYQAGESARGATDEAISVIDLLDRDLAAAVPPRQGGIFHAHSPQGAAAGNCLVAWTIGNPAVLGGSSRFVVWGVVNGQLRRRVSDNPVDLNDAPLAGSSVVSGDCLHFGVWLAGTPVGAVEDGLLATVPQDGWQRIRSRGTNPLVIDSEPVVDPLPYASDAADFAAARDPAYGYPSALRFTILLRAGRAEREGVVVSDDGGLNLRIAGLPQLPSGPGNVIRIGDELVGFTGIDADGRLRVNQREGDGPRNLDTDSGRGIWRSLSPDGGHPPGTAVRLGQRWTLTRTLWR